jgi:hypothetical protein
MDSLKLQFATAGPKGRGVVPIMSPDNKLERLAMTTSLSALNSISIEQGIEIANKMWAAFKGQSDISPYITSASACTNHGVKNKEIGDKEGVLVIEALLPSEQLLDHIDSNKPSVEFMVSDLNYRSKDSPVTMVATVNTAKAVEPKSSLLGKIVGFAVRALTPARVAASEPGDSEKLLETPSPDTAAD